MRILTNQRKAIGSYQSGDSAGLVGNGGFDALVSDHAARMCPAGEHVFALQPGIGAKQILDGVAGRQHSENVRQRAGDRE